MIRATGSVPREIFWAQSAHSSKSRAVGEEGTLSPIVAITSAVTAIIVAEKPFCHTTCRRHAKIFSRPSRSCDILRHFPSKSVARQSQQAFLFVATASRRHQELSRTFLVFTFEHFDSHYVALRNRRDLRLRGGGIGKRACSPCGRGRRTIA